MTEFHDDIAAHPTDIEGEFSVEVSDRWSVGGGANGGYIAAMFANAIGLSEPERRLRSMTLHYLRPPQPGPATLSVQVLRSGRSLSVLDLALTRDGAPIVVARAAVASPRDTPEFTERTAPNFPDPASIPGEQWPDSGFVRARYDTRYVSGGTPPLEVDATDSSGWIRTIDHAPIDLPLAVAFTDGWIPPVMMRNQAAHGASTIDLTIQVFGNFADPAPGWCAVTNRSSVAADGYVETDSEVWSADGQLLATGRQLSAMIERPMGL